MGRPVVKCNVANCAFWQEGNRCNAETILVEIDGHANSNYNTEMSTEIDIKPDHKDVAVDKADTCCHTFRPREKKK